LLLAGVNTLAALIPLGKVAMAALAAGLAAAYLFGRYASSKLGGVTGDVYGAAELLTEATVLASILAIGKFA
jgi:adenosylcobinamide-GDP ribazoletransferase